MDDHLASDGQSGAVAWKDDPDEARLPPQGSGEGHEAMMLQPEEEEEHQHHQLHSQQQQQQQQQQHHHHRQQPQHQHELEDASSSLSSPCPSPTSRKSSPGRAVERLARRLSRHNMLLQPDMDDPSHAQLQAPTAPLSQPSSATALPELREPPYLQPPALPILDDISHPQLVAAPPAGGDETQWPPVDLGGPIEVDDAYQIEKPADSRSDTRKLLRQPASGQQLRAGSSTSRPVNPRISDLIASGTQCNVRTDPLSVSTPSQSSQPAPPSASAATPSFIEPDPAYAMPGLEMDVRPVRADAGDEASNSLGYGLRNPPLSLRRASGPGGVRKYTTGSITLTYRSSADAAFSCNNIVRSPIRVRKRTKVRPRSGAPSASTSAVASPNQTSIPPPIPPPP